MIDGGRRGVASIGLAGGLAVAAVIVVFLPFATFALIRLTGWDWWVALAALVALNLLPLLGQMALIVLAVMGAFTLGQDNLAERKALPTAQQVGSAQAGAGLAGNEVSSDAPRMAGKTFEEWRRTVAAPAIQESCLQDVQRRGLAGSAQLDQMARACACYGAAAESVITQADVEDGKLSPTSGFNERLAVQARQICSGK